MQPLHLGGEFYVGIPAGMSLGPLKLTFIASVVQGTVLVKCWVPIFKTLWHQVCRLGSVLHCQRLFLTLVALLNIS